jgi:hypothetical protein
MPLDSLDLRHPRVSQADPRVIEIAGALTLEPLQRLFDRSSGVLALVVRGYYPRHLCEQFSERLDAGELVLGKYRNVPNIPVSKFGATFGEACAIPELMDRYFDIAPTTEQQLRDFFAPQLGPLDKLRLDLDVLWAKGCVIPEMYGRRMSSGFIRSLATGGSIPPHQDDLLEEAPRPPDFRPTTELVHNVYLRVPAPGEGGELEIFDYAPDYAGEDIDDYLIHKGADETLLPASTEAELSSQSSVVIRPDVGDLVLFRAKCVHRVYPVRSGGRVTTCNHIAYVNDHEPLRCWI